MTVLFADVANYTSIAEKLDPEEAHQIMDGCFKILMDEIHRYEGTINQFTGDGVMALFGAPLAHEDHAQRACYASLSIRKAIGGYGEKIQREYGADFQIRIGLNSGPVIVGSIGDDLRMDYTAVGDTTNLAARIQQAATAGEVWMSEHTRNLVKDYLQEEEVGELALKGKAQAQTLYRVVSDRPEVRTRFEAGLVRGMTELVGRRAELANLRAALERARAGEAQFVDIVGEPGVGKSRLVYEFRKALRGTVEFLSGVCIQYGRTINFYPLIDLVKEVFGIEEGMSEGEARGRVREGAGPGLASCVSFYESLLSLRVKDPRFNALNPEGRKYGTFEAVKDLLLASSEERPLVLFLEDAQWMDKLSEEFFTYFSRCIHGHKVLMLAAYRPEGSPAWAQGAAYQRLGLETLSSESSIRLVRNILGGSALDPGLERRIAEKTEGNPFFVEEIVRELVDRGDLEKTGDRYLCKRPIEQIEIPSTVRGVLSARMDRLSEDLKRTMQVASVIGRDFVYRILKSIMELGEELRTHLSNLVGLEILYEKALYPELEYIFKHALTQEVAYESLLKQRRRKIHERVAQTIEDLYAGNLEEHYEVLAHHYELSGNETETVQYLLLAGEKSHKQKAAHTTCEFFEKALHIADREHIDLRPEVEVRAHHTLGLARIDVGDLAAARNETAKVAELCRQYGMIEQEIEALGIQAGAIWADPPPEDEALAFFEKCIARARQANDRAKEGWIRSSQGFYLCSKGKVRQGYEMVVDGQTMSADSGDAAAELFSLTFRFAVERWAGNPAKVVELTEGILDALREVFNLTVLSGGMFQRGVALADIGRIGEAITLFSEGIDICEKLGGMFWLSRLYNCLGYCYSEILHPERAWPFNLKSEKLARDQMKQYPVGRKAAAEVAAQASVNLMENLFDQGKQDEAWERIISLEQEAKSEDFTIFRILWETRMEYLAAQILLERDEVARAETLIQENLERSRREHLKKNEGRFLRLVGEVQARRKESANAFTTLNEAIRILEEVGNRRQLWQAHASLASAFERFGRSAEAGAQWGAAAEVIHGTANGLSDRELREGFLAAIPIREILRKTEA